MGSTRSIIRHGSEGAGSTSGDAWRFDGELIERAYEGCTVAGALISEGRLMTSRSAKYRRPRGPYCLQGDCGTCLVRIDGRPNLRACMVPWRAGMQVERQNTYRPAGLDPTSLVDRVFSGGIDHHHLAVRPRILNQAMQTFARQLTGFGEVPERTVAVDAEVEHHSPAVLIVGAGPAGVAVARTLERVGVEHLLLDRRDEVELPEAAKCANFRSQVGIFAAYELDDLWAGGRELRTPDGGHRVSLHTFRSPHVVLATGARDPMIELANNDLPGVVSARGLIRQLARTDAKVEGALVVIGSGPNAEACATALGADRLEPDDVVRIEGHGRVQRVVTRNRTIRCDLVALAGPPAPAHELAAQAGAEVHFDGSGFAVRRDDDGVCAQFNDTTVWAVGDVSGWLGPRAAAEDGTRIAERLVTRLARATAQKVYATNRSETSSEGETP